MRLGSFEQVLRELVRSFLRMGCQITLLVQVNVAGGHGNSAFPPRFRALSHLRAFDTVWFEIDSKLTLLRGPGRQ
jgi:hypothetical protein